MKAEFHSKCAVCGEWIEEDDEVEYSDDADDWVHYDCWEEKP